MRVTEEEKKEWMRKLYEEGYKIGEIAKEAKRPWSTVWYHLDPEARERAREYRRKRELEKGLSLGNIYADIMMCLKEGYKWGRKYKQIWRCLEEKYTSEELKIKKSELRGKLKELESLGLIKFNKEEKRYSLTDKGKELINALMMKLKL